MVDILTIFNPFSINHLKAFNYAVNQPNGQMPSWFEEGMIFSYTEGWQGEIIAKLARHYVEMALEGKVHGLNWDGLKIDIDGENREAQERRKFNEKITGVHR